MSLNDQKAHNVFKKAVCFNWKMIASQCCVGFSHTKMQISHEDTYTHTYTYIYICIYIYVLPPLEPPWSTRNKAPIES